ncbi:MAG: hypothetical protein JXR42_06065 [Gammaproteobacteria bacterium]|nr:hypothetical protein [Gammaproteobacteria bacterium]
MKSSHFKAIVSIGVFLISTGAINNLAFAANTQTLTINAVVGAQAKLTMTPLTINFPDADPDVTSVIDADSPVAVTVNARAGAASTLTLTANAQSDLSDGGTNTISIANVAWIVDAGSDAGFLPGTLSNGVDVSAGTWTGGGSRSGSLKFKFVNSWNYVPATYTANVLFTLSVT